MVGQKGAFPYSYQVGFVLLLVPILSTKTSMEIVPQFNWMERRMYTTPLSVLMLEHQGLQVFRREKYLNSLGLTCACSILM